MFIPVSYTHLDVYKRQADKQVQSLNSCITKYSPENKISSQLSMRSCHSFIYTLISFTTLYTHQFKTVQILS